jgi:hypothetical protein
MGQIIYRHFNETVIAKTFSEDTFIYVRSVVKGLFANSLMVARV